MMCSRMRSFPVLLNDPKAFQNLQLMVTQTYTLPYFYMVFDRAIILVDEFQNLNFHELDSIMTRVGENTKIMFCGDATQTDLIKQNERNGIVDFMRVLRLMSSIDIIEFGVEDIVRSGLVKEFILAKMELNL